MSDTSLLVQIAKDVGELKGQVYEMRGSIARIERLSERVTALEKDRSYARGVVAAVGAVMGTLASLLIGFLKGLLS